MRGDQVAGKAFGYECCWRAYLMLEIQSWETLTIYQGEDACITKLDGQKVYYQIKHTTGMWTPSRVKEFLDRACERLQSDPRVSYVFCTNSRLSDDLQEQFAEVNKQFNDRLSSRIVAFDAENPTSRIFFKIRDLIEGHFHPRHVRGVLKLDQVDNCCDRLLAMEAEFKLDGDFAVTGQEVWDRVGITRVIQEIPSLVLGKGLFSWSDWLSKAGRPSSNPALEATRKIVYEDDDIEVELENKLINLVTQWAERQNNNLILLVSGVSGTGKTWLLIRTAMRLFPEVAVYWADTTALGSMPKLSELAAWQGGPTVVFIDDVIEQLWDRALHSASTTNTPLVVICATARPSFNKRINELRRLFGTGLRILDVPPLFSQKQNLIQKLRQGVVTRSEQEEMGSTNIRYAVRILKGQPRHEDLTNALFNLWHESAVQPWLTPVLLCSSLGIKIPNSLLRLVSRLEPLSERELPESLSSFLLRRSVPQDQYVWIEDSTVALQVFVNIRNEIGEAIDESRLEQAVRLLASVRSNLPIHRQFARQFVREFCDAHPQLMPQLLTDSQKKVLELLSYEEQESLAYVWLPILPRAQRSLAARKAAEEFFSSKPPQSVAEILLFLHAFGDKRTESFLLKELAGTYQGGVELWATFIEHLTVLDRKSQRMLLRRALIVLRSAKIRLSELLAKRNVESELLTLVCRVGMAHDRDWFFELLHKNLLDALTNDTRRGLKSVHQYFKLAKRCLTQLRAAITMRSLKKLLNPVNANEVSIQRILGELYDDYRKAYGTEALRSIDVQAIKVGLDYARLELPPTNANMLWPALITFASNWGSEPAKREVMIEARKFLTSVFSKNLPVKIVEVTAFAYCQFVDRSEAVTPDVPTIVLALAHSTEFETSFRLFILLTMQVAKSESNNVELAQSARQVMLRLASRSDELPELASGFLEAVTSGLGYKELPFKDSLLTSIEKEWSSSVPIQVELIRCFRNMKWDSSERDLVIEAMMSNCNRSSSIVMNQLVQTLLRFGVEQPSSTLIKHLLTTHDHDPDVSMFAAAWEARFGTVERAEAYLRNSYLVRGGVKGPHIPNLSPTFWNLAQACEGFKRECYLLCGALSKQGRLPDIKEVLIERTDKGSI